MGAEKIGSISCLVFVSVHLSKWCQGNTVEPLDKRPLGTDERPLLFKFKDHCFWNLSLIIASSLAISIWVCCFSVFLMAARFNLNIFFNVCVVWPWGADLTVFKFVLDGRKYSDPESSKGWKAMPTFTSTSSSLFFSSCFSVSSRLKVNQKKVKWKSHQTVLLTE